MNDALTIEPVSVIVCVGEKRVGVIRDRDGQIEATALARRYLPLGNLTTRDATVGAIFTATTKPP